MRREFCRQRRFLSLLELLVSPLDRPREHAVAGIAPNSVMVMLMLRGEFQDLAKHYAPDAADDRQTGNGLARCQWAGRYRMTIVSGQYRAEREHTRYRLGS
jgi:hypothetical protein